MATSDQAMTKREAIVDAATAVFSEKGFVGANLDEVVAAAAVSKQTLYKHFADKASLFQEIVRELGSQVDGRILDLPQPEAVDDVEEWIHTLALRFTRTVMDPKVQRIRRLVMAEAPRFPEVATAYWEGGFHRVIGTVAEHFRALAEAGRLQIEDPQTAAEHFAGMLLWIPSNRTMFGGSAHVVGDDELEAYAHAGAAAFLRAYGGPASASPPTTSL